MIVESRCPQCQHVTLVNQGDEGFVTCICGRKPPQPVRTVTDCIYRDKETPPRLLTCRPCHDSKIKVYKCEQHGECTIGKKMPHLACCKNCRQYVSPLTLPDPDGRVRVGFLSVVYSQIGGTETWHRTILPHLNDNDSVQLVGFVSTWQTGGNYELLNCPTGHGVEAARQLAESVDILVEWGVNDLASVLPKKKPYVISVHHGDTSSNWARQMIKSRLKISNEFVCVNPNVADYQRNLGVAASYIPNGVRDGSLPRRNIHETIALWTGRFAAEKRSELVLEIAKLLPEITFRMLGSGVTDKFRRKTKKIPNVQIANPVLETWVDLSRAAVLLSTSNEEGFGYSMAEAMLARCPVVATPCGIASSNLCTIVPTEGDARLWAERILQTLRTPIPERLERARNYVLDNHSAEKVTLQWIDLFRARVRQQ